MLVICTYYLCRLWIINPIQRSFSIIIILYILDKNKEHRCTEKNKACKNDLSIKLSKSCIRRHMVCFLEEM